MKNSSAGVDGLFNSGSDTSTDAVADAPTDSPLLPPSDGAADSPKNANVDGAPALAGDATVVHDASAGGTIGTGGMTTTGGTMTAGSTGTGGITGAGGTPLTGGALGLGGVTSDGGIGGLLSADAALKLDAPEASKCGDGILAGSEQCDDGNVRPFDGCSPACTNEPKCGYPNNDPAQPYQCFSVCGDGIKMPDEACDDGNVQNGDGCSSTCTIEPGYTCTASAPALGTSLTVPILYRDFNWHHPQFEVSPVYDQRQVGIANSAIGVNGKPVYNTAYVGNNAGTSLGRPWTMDGPAMSTTDTLMSDATGATFRTKTSSNTASLSAAQIAASYAEWYTDDPNATGDPTVDAANPAVTRITIQSTLTLNQISTGTYQFYSSAFFPLDGLGFGNINYPSTNPTLVHNFSFTSEAHYWFQYGGGERIEFRGGDDVWVFVNGQLAVDLGGIYNELRGIVTLNCASTQACADDTAPACAGQAVCDTPAPPNCTTFASGFGMVPGNIYEIAVFQAQRHVTSSNYKLTLSGFNAPKSACNPL